MIIIYKTIHALALILNDGLLETESFLILNNFRPITERYEIRYETQTKKNEDILLAKRLVSFEKLYLYTISELLLFCI